MSSKTPQLETIKFGEETHTIDVSKIPYLSSFVRFERAAHPDSQEFIHSPVPHLNVVLLGIKSGYQECFRYHHLPLSSFQSICETYELFCMKILQGKSILELIDDMKVSTNTVGRVREAAFRFLYLILLGDFEDEIMDAIRVYNGVFYVVSHRKAFGWNTVRLVREAYLERFDATEKQKQALNER